MKNLLVFVCWLLALNFEALAYKKDPDFLEAERNGAETCIRLVAKTDEGVPVPNAQVEVLMGMTFRERAYCLNGTTDTNGVFVISGKTTGNEIEIKVQKDGYYKAFKKLSYIRMGREHEVKDGRWLPWGDTLNIPLREIKSPVSLICHNAGFDIPNNGEWIGFDMEKQDWVAPAGKGKIEDFAVNLKWDGKQSMYSDLLELRVRFSRDGDGYYYGDKTYGSAFSGVYQVDTNQCLQTELVCKVEKVDGGWKETGIPNGKLMVVRSRTTLDQHGAVIDTNYSVIRSISIFGGWHGTAEMGLNYQFNPIPNNTNLEPKR